MPHESLATERQIDSAVAEVTAADRGISAQARSISDLDRVLDRLVRRDPARGGALLDLGCGMGGLANYIGGRLGLDELVGVDLDSDRLKAASARGVRPLLLDLNDEPLPLDSGSVRVVTCFGLLAYLTLYDNTVSEAARVLQDGGWLVLSMPNLGSYANRLALLLGFQPHAVAVSHHRQAGTMSHRRDPKTSANMPPLLHGATLRCMRELLDDYGFETAMVRGFAPGPRRRPVVDGITSCFPSLSRRFLILARKRPVA
ncbi:MAG TPA: class I SAM-dependent methyltransferase [Acidimicrobiia bacterium]|jgi:SAM-dependent methyltransferase|nr:class I SAM-dependent methyltransferase [Acidimicrobiia bacterium]